MDLRRHAALLAFLAALVALAVAAFAGFADFLLDPIRAQAEHRAGGGYTTESLAAWAALGLLGAVAYAKESEARPLLRLGPRTLAALLPLLAFGPLFHALLPARALPTSVAYLATEPTVYATVAALALALGAAGAAIRREDPAKGRDVALAVGGGVLLAAAFAMALPRFGPLARTAALLAFLGAILAVLAWSALRFAPARWLSEARRPFALAVFFGHALDGATTWIGVRDPFGWGIGGFREKNPVSDALLSLGNGWPFLAVKLLLPAVLLVALRDLEDEHHRNLALLAIFALGFGPGSANAWQMSFAG